jgi:DNA-binding MarR family transcriptional regulator
MPGDPDETELIEGGVAAGTAVVPALAGYTGHLLRAAHMAALGHARAKLPGNAQPRVYGILTLLASTGPRSQNELGELLGVNRTIMVKVVDDMEASGLLERRRNPADRRSYALQPTQEGLATLERLDPAVREAEATFTAPVGKAGRARLNKLLCTLLAGLGHEAPKPLADHTGYLLAAAHLHVRERFEAALEPLGIEARQFGALATIAAAAPCSQQLVAQQLGVTGPVVVQLVDGLERRGLVTRERNPADRRSYALRPTARGRTVLRRSHAATDGISAMIAEPLGPEGDAELRALLQKLLGVSAAPSAARRRAG